MTCESLPMSMDLFIFGLVAFRRDSSLGHRVGVRRVLTFEEFLRSATVQSRSDTKKVRVDVSQLWDPINRVCLSANSRAYV